MTTTTTILVYGALIVLAVGVLLLVRSVRKLRQAREALARSQERLTLTLHASGIGVWTWDMLKDVITVDENCSVLFGLPPGQFPQNLEQFRALIHPEDRERVQQEILACVEHGADYNIEYCVVWPQQSDLSGGQLQRHEDQRARRRGICDR